MIHLLRLLGFTGLVVAGPSYAHEHIQNRVGIKSEVVLRNDLRQMGFDVSRIDMGGTRASAVVTIDGSPAILILDRMGGGAAVVAAPPAIRPLLQDRIGPILKPSRLLRPQGTLFSPTD